MQIQELMHKMDADPALVKQIKADPQAAIKAVGGTPLSTDVMLYRIVVAGLSSAVLLSIIGAIVLAVFGKPTPEVVTALGSAAVGALAGLLAPSPVRT